MILCLMFSSFGDVFSWLGVLWTLTQLAQETRSEATRSTSCRSQINSYEVSPEVLTFASIVKLHVDTRARALPTNPPTQLEAPKPKTLNPVSMRSRYATIYLFNSFPSLAAQTLPIPKP